MQPEVEAECNRLTAALSQAPFVSVLMFSSNGLHALVSLVRVSNSTADKEEGG